MTLQKLCFAYYFTRFQIAQAPDLDAVALETEMGLRLPLRSLVWELMGDDYGTRAVSLSVNLGKCHVMIFDPLNTCKG